MLHAPGTTKQKSGAQTKPTPGFEIVLSFGTKRQGHGWPTLSVREIHWRTSFELNSTVNEVIYF